MVTNFKKSFLLLITAIFFTQSLILGCSTEVDSEIKKMEEEKETSKTPVFVGTWDSFDETITIDDKFTFSLETKKESGTVQDVNNGFKCVSTTKDDKGNNKTYNFTKVEADVISSSDVVTGKTVYFVKHSDSQKDAELNGIWECDNGTEIIINAETKKICVTTENGQIWGTYTQNGNTFVIADENGNILGSGFVSASGKAYFYNEATDSFEIYTKDAEAGAPVIPLKKFTVTYKSKFADDVVKPCAENVEITLEDASYEGYRFDGWYTDEARTVKAEAKYKVTQDLVFYAKWVQQGKVTFVSEHSEHDAVVVDLGNTIEELPAPTKEKYDFDGWYDGEDKVESPYEVTKNVELTAKWTALYNVTYETDGTSVEPRTVRAGTEITIETTTHGTYEFECWMFDNETYNAGAKYIVNSDVKFVVKWKGLYTITYSTDGGETIVTKSVSEGSSFELPEEPTRDGYVFKGWYLEDENNLLNPGDSISVTENLEIKAKWVKLYTYYYFNNYEEVGEIDPSTLLKAEDGSEITVDPAIERPGYVFKGWSVDEQIYQPGASYTITKNVVFTAEWNPEYTYQFEGSEAKTVENGTKITIANALKAEDCTFAGWYDGTNTYQFGDVYEITDNVTFTAVWNVTVTYVSEHTDHEKVTIEKGSTLDLPNPTDEGYDFDGWFKEGDEKVDSPHTVDANITLTAKWTKLWTVTYMSDGEKINSEIVRDGESIVLKAPSIEKTGHTFDCWQDGGAGINDSSIEITADITLTALWEKIPVAYSISGVPTTGWGVVEVYVYNEAEGRENGEPLGNNHSVDGEGNIIFETAKDITHCILVSFGDPDPSSEMPSYSNLEDLLNVSSTYSEDLNVTSGKATFVQYVPKVTYTIKNAEGYNTPYVTIDGEEVASVYNSETKTVTFEYAEDLTGCLIAKNDSHSAEKEIIFDENGIGMINSQYSFVIDPNQVYFRNSKNWHGGIQVYAYHSSDPKNEVRIDMTKAADTDQWYYADVDYSLYDTVYFAGQTTNNTNDNGETVSIKLDKSKIFYRPSDNRDSSLGEDSGGRDKFNVMNFEKINDWAPGFN